MQIERFGGLAGLRDEGALESALGRPMHKAHYRCCDDAGELAAAYLFSLARNHAFVDTNKRIAIVAAGVFLLENGYEIEPTDANLYAFVLAVAAGEIDEEGATRFLRDSACRSTRSLHLLLFQFPAESFEHMRPAFPGLFLVFGPFGAHFVGQRQTAAAAERLDVDFDAVAIVVVVLDGKAEDHAPRTLQLQEHPLVKGVAGRAAVDDEKTAADMRIDVGADDVTVIGGKQEAAGDFRVEPGVIDDSGRRSVGMADMQFDGAGGHRFSSGRARASFPGAQATAVPSAHRTGLLFCWVTAVK
ncbi:death-on-curing family protein [Rhizobium lentis]|uniref:Death-on-curing family protein n=1 Tax=Rhizobium lentis TaxID=1138194 RepID=A0A7W8XE56_9HYPH|nr:death-on-curing family protein [Rhizobium lentis]MBB5560301.1 death-on-curing family protein [Rhizobium lentis]MBB5566811.1 death-on-curing family protein [Rhizobium lentis]